MPTASKTAAAKPAADPPLYSTEQLVRADALEAAKTLLGADQPNAYDLLEVARYIEGVPPLMDAQDSDDDGSGGLTFTGAPTTTEEGTQQS